MILAKVPDRKNTIVTLGDSLCRAWDQYAERRGQQYNTPEHQECYLIPQPRPRHQIIHELHQEGRDYLNSFFPEWEVFPISIPGLTTQDALSDKIIPYGPLQGQGVLSALQSFKHARVSSIVIGTNNWHSSLSQLATSDAVRTFFQCIQQIYKGTCFDVIFISTLWPRGSFYEQGVVDPDLAAFNQMLQQVRDDGSYENKLKVKDKFGEHKIIQWRLVDLSKHISYEEMAPDGSELYCSRFPDVTHPRAYVAQIYLSKLSQALRLWENKKRRKEKYVSPLYKPCTRIHKDAPTREFGAQTCPNSATVSTQTDFCYNCKTASGPALVLKEKDHPHTRKLFYTSEHRIKQEQRRKFAEGVRHAQAQARPPRPRPPPPHWDYYHAPANWCPARPGHRGRPFKRLLSFHRVGSVYFG